MDIACKFKSNTACDMKFGLTLPVRLIPRQISVNLWTFRKIHELHNLKKKCKNVPSTWAGHFLYQISCSHCSNDAKEADILGHFSLPPLIPTKTPDGIFVNARHPE